MSTDLSQSGGSLPSVAENEIELANEKENETGLESCQGVPVNEDVRNAFYASKSQNFTERPSRTDLRATDQHCSWREVSRACHVEPGR